MQRSKAAILVALLLAGLLYAATRKAPVRNFGYQPNPEGVQRFLAELEQPFFFQAGAEAMERATGSDTFLYRPMYRAHRARYGNDFEVGRQLIGSCVAWGAMHAVYVAESVDWDLGRIPEPPLMPATEPLYGGSRVEARGKDGSGRSPVGGWSDGSYGGAAAKWLRDWGVVYRKPYEAWDYTTYDHKREKQEGAYGCGGQGDNGRLDEVAKKHPCKHVVQVRTWDELAAALESGFPVTIASNQGFSSQRDRLGYSEAQGSWAHQMMALAIRHKKNGSPDDAALILNSWGPDWNGPPENRWPDDMPAGSFWARRPVVERMLSQGDAWAIGSVDGFHYRDLHHGNWLGPVRKDSQ